MRNAVVLLSGGLDSSTVLAIARDQGYRPFALSFEYGQRHQLELGAARRIARDMAVAEHVVLTIDLRQFGGSALTADIDVPKGRSDEDMARGVPITYVPARNTVFLSFALAWLEVLDARDIFIGVNALDYSGYPDCRPAFIEAFERTANLATRIGTESDDAIRVHAPLIDLSKAEIIRRGVALGVDYGLTISCYDPDTDGRACGDCDACALRRRGFAVAGVADPTRYRAEP